MPFEILFNKDPNVGVPKILQVFKELLKRKVVKEAKLLKRQSC